MKNVGYYSSFLWSCTCAFGLLHNNIIVVIVKSAQLYADVTMLCVYATVLSLSLAMLSLNLV